MKFRLWKFIVYLAVIAPASIGLAYLGFGPMAKVGAAGLSAIAAFFVVEFIEKRRSENKVSAQ